MRVSSRATPRSGAALLAALLLACAEPQDVRLPTIRPEPIYEALYPHYAEICALDQYRKFDGQLGTAAGHAVMYLKGACLVADAPYPRLEPCLRNSDDPLDPAHGTGISVNRILRNVNWLGVPGKGLFFDGDLDREQVLDAEHYETTVRRAVESGVFRGVRVHGDALARWPEDMPLEEIVAREAIGTDYALRFARTVLCARLPVSAPMLERIIGFLNAINEEYATGEADYNWSGYHDNCAHLLRNALAAASVWRPKAVWEIKLRQIFHLAIPANEFLALAERGNEFPIDQHWRVFLDGEASSALEEFGWLPTRDGALLRILPIHGANQVFDTRYALFVLEDPLRRPRTRQLARMLGEARYHDLEANLRHFESTYARILAVHPATGEADPGDRRERWRAYLEDELAAVRERLRRLCAERPCAEASAAAGARAAAQQSKLQITSAPPRRSPPSAPAARAGARRPGRREPRTE
jgi:hypothetical protein